MEKQKTSAKARTKNWTAIIYPESAPDNWRELIDEMHIEWIESPLHDKDLNATGEQKKAHIHVLLMFGGLKSYQQVIDVLKPLNCTIPQICQNVKALVRYFAHLDNPDKVQYSQGDIKGHGGVELADLLKVSSSQRYVLIREIFDYIIKNNITEVEDLLVYSMNEHFDDWFPILCDNSMFVVNSFIKSRRHRQHTPLNICSETGEILD